MIQYQNCFLGIKINPVIYEQLNIAYKILNENIPDIHMILISTSHITIYFIDDKSEHELRSIIPLIKDTLNNEKTIKTIRIKNLNADYFDLIQHLVIIYHIEMNLELRKIYEIMKTSLAFIKRSRVSFVPHLTLGRIYDEACKLTYYTNRNRICEDLDKISFEFTATELLLIGREKETKIITPIESFNLD